MPDPSQPKGRPDAPVEGQTKAFSLKFDGWMSELMKKDLGLEAEAPEAPGGAAPEAPAELEPPAAPGGNAPDGTVPGGRTGRSSG
jgi:hypothetical protein